MRTTLYLRIAAVLTFIHAALHTIGGMFGGVAPGAMQTAVSAMKGNEFVAMGVTRQLLGLLYGIRFGGLGLHDGGGGCLLAAGFAGKDRCVAAAAGYLRRSLWVFSPWPWCRTSISLRGR